MSQKRTYYNKYGLRSSKTITTEGLEDKWVHQLQQHHWVKDHDLRLLTHRLKSLQHDTLQPETGQHMEYACNVTQESNGMKQLYYMHVVKAIVYHFSMVWIFQYIQCTDPLWLHSVIVYHVRNKSNLALLNTWETNTIAIFPSCQACLVWLYIVQCGAQLRFGSFVVVFS